MGVMDTIRGLLGGARPRPAEDAPVIERPPDVENPKVPQHLMDRVRKAFFDMSRIRDEHYSGVKEFVGPYSVAGNQSIGLGRGSSEVVERRLPLPLIRNFVQIYTHLLASGTPQSNVSTEKEELKPFAEDLKTVLNRQLVECKVPAAVAGGTWSAMFSVGIVKTGLAEGTESFEFEGEFYDPGRPFSQSVSLRNFVIDMQADSLQEISFIGDRYLRPREWVNAIKEKRDGRQASDSGVTDPTNSSMPAPVRVSGVGESEDRRLYDEVWVWDIYLPKQGVFCQYEDGEDEPLRIFDWDGPEGGPYDLLGFGWVDGEVLPAAPVPALRPMAELVNAAARKVERQAYRAKEVYVGDRSGGGEDDMKALRDAKDGDVVAITNPQALQPVRYGGPHPSLMALIPWGLAEFDKNAGNLSLLAGLGTSSDTLGQDRILARSANAQIDAMRRAVTEMVVNIIRKHAWYVWTEPMRTFSAEKDIGAGVRIPISMAPKVREGDFLDYNFELEPYSMSQSSPGDRVAQLRAFWMQDVVPNVQLLMQAGQMVDAAAYIRKLAEMTNMPMADQILLEQSPDARQSAQEIVPEPPQVSGSRGGGAPGGRDHNQQFMQALGAIGQNNAQ